jgi:hypothetical protein
MTDHGKTGTCALCGQEYHDHGHNPRPVLDDPDARVCATCNERVVIPARLGGSGSADADRRHETLVELTSGERLAAPETRDDGVVTDAGLISWSDVRGFWAWSRQLGRYVFVPKD